MDNIGDDTELTQNDTAQHTAKGNTTKSFRARRWVYTWNNHTNTDFDTMKGWCVLHCTVYRAQEETGENGTPHIQGYWEFKNARDFKSLHKLWPKCHIEVCKNKEAAMNYCMKEDTRTGQQMSSERILIDKIKEYKPWQQEIVDLVQNEPDDRSIHWYRDTVGASGKTTLARHLCIKRPNEVLYMTGKCADVKYGICKFLSNPENDLKIIIFDFVRSTENFISYEAIETVKNGIFYNTKYESEMVIYNPPHIIIFANFMPQLDKLSQDRWHIHDLDDKKIELNDVDKYIAEL